MSISSLMSCMLSTGGGTLNVMVFLMVSASKDTSWYFFLKKGAIVLARRLVAVVAMLIDCYIY